MELEYYKKFDETISKFNNGKERFKTSSLFNVTINTLVREGDPIKLIDQLIEMNDNLRKDFEQYINSH